MLVASIFIFCLSFSTVLSSGLRAGYRAGWRYSGSESVTMQSAWAQKGTGVSIVVL